MSRRNPPQSISFVDLVRDGIHRSGESLQAIAERAGLARSAVSRFASGQRGLSDESFAALAAALGYRLIGGPTPPRRPVGRRLSDPTGTSQAAAAGPSERDERPGKP